MKPSLGEGRRASSGSAHCQPALPTTGRPRGLTAGPRHCGNDGTQERVHRRRRLEHSSHVGGQNYSRGVLQAGGIGIRFRLGPEARTKLVERQLEALAEQLPAVQFLLTVPGIGLLIATAFVAFIGDIRRFPSSRHLASYLGLTPREFSSGLKRHLGRISKRPGTLGRSPL